MVKASRHIIGDAMEGMQKTASSIWYYGKDKGTKKTKNKKKDKNNTKNKNKNDDTNKKKKTQK